MKTFLLPAILLLLSAVNLVQAGELKEFAAFIFENDAFTDDSDDGYSNGMGYAWGRAGFNGFDDSNTPGWIHWLSEDLYISTMSDKRRAITYQIFQATTTPADSEIKELQPNDYPYAATLAWKVTQYASDDKVTDSVSLLLGVVGPASLAEPVQKLIHEITDSQAPEGWDNQLNNEPLFQLGVGRKWRILDGNFAGGTNYDVITAVEGTVGNLSSNADAGVTFRFGTSLLQTYPIASLWPAREVNPMTGTALGNYYVFLSLMGRYQANYIVVDGNSSAFDDDNNSDITLEHNQNFVSAGFAVSFKSWSLILSVVDASKDVKEDDDDRYRFGSLSVSWNVD